MIKEILNEKNISMYVVSKESGIPYSTLNELVNGKKNPENCSIRTISALASCLGMTVDELMRRLIHKPETVTIRQTWQEKRYRKFTFPVIEKSEGYDASKIHPLKQRIAKKLYRFLSANEDIERVILFGSSTNIRCTKRSDIDLALGLKDDGRSNKELNKVRDNISEAIEDLCRCEVDIIWLDRVKEGSKLYNNIERGVRLV